MQRFILTGAPGAGKTAILRALEIQGYAVVEEAATDVIALEQARGVAEPWRDAAFIDAIVELQRRRHMRAAPLDESIQFHDRSAVCTLALARYLGFAMSARLAEELQRIEQERAFTRRVFLVENLGFIVPTEARRITFEETLRFEQIHEQTYGELGYELLRVKAGPVEQRVAEILRLVNGS